MPDLPRSRGASAARIVARLPVTVVGAALVIRLIDEWWAYLPTGIVEDLRRDLGVSYAGSGWLIGLLYAGGLLGTPLGLLADHVDRRLTSATGAGLVTAGLTAYAAGAAYPVLALSSLLLGAASDLMIRPVEAALAETAGDRLDRLLGRQHLLTWLGDFVGPAVLAVGAVTALGWRGAFGVTALATGLFATYLAAVPFPPPTDPAGSGREALAGLAAVARRRDVWVVAVADLLLGAFDEPFLAVAVARTARAEGSSGLAQLVAAGLVVGGIAGSLVVDRIGLSAGVRRVAPAALLAGAVGTAAATATWAVVLAMGVLGVGMALAWAAVHHRLLTVVPGRSGTVAALAGTISAAGVAFPVVAGAVADRWGLTVAVAGYAALTALFLVCWSRIGAVP